MATSNEHIEAFVRQAIAAERERCAQEIQGLIRNLNWSHSCAEFIDERLQAALAAIRKGE